MLILYDFADIIKIVKEEVTNQEVIEMTNNLRKQLKSFINNGKSLVYIINYLFTLDYEEVEIVEMLTGRGFNCNKNLLLDTLEYHFAIDCQELR